MLIQELESFEFWGRVTLDLSCAFVDLNFRDIKSDAIELEFKQEVGEGGK